MKRYKSLLSLKWVAVLLLVVGFVSCADEEIVDNQKVVEGVMTDVKFSFTYPTPAKVESRGAISTLDEYKVHNLYVYIFDKSGKNGELFKFNYDQLENKTEKTDAASQTTTAGEVSLKVSSGEKRIYAVANVADQAPITTPATAWEDITTVDALKNNIISMTQEAIFRGNGKLLMGGAFENNPQSEQPEGYCNILPSNARTYTSIKLVRVDARITFNVNLIDKKEQKFVPRTWKVMNLPKKVYLFKNEEGKNASDVADDYWDMSNTYNFESTENGVSTFTFYAMENSYTTEGLKNYEDREKEDKQTDGKNYEDPHFTNAPQNATYVILTGDYYERYTENGVTKERRADVTYAIHLGYVDDKPNNFECNRNTTYTYNVTVEGVDKIRVEVLENKEEQPGAEGNIVETDEFYLFDSHYDRALITFYKDSISNKVGFVLKTPFDDAYYYVDGVESNTGLINAKPSTDAKDYKWVSFRRNDRYTSDGGYDVENFMPYHPNEVMDVVELLTELNGHKNDKESDRSFFDSNNKVVYTVFIKENYYDKDPRDENNTNFSWKDFVNQDNREMHVLCNTQRSKDDESSLTTSSIMISQRSIRTFYNEKAGSDLQTAWGLESVNETGEIAPRKSNGRWVNPWTASNLTVDNGRWNFFQQMNFNESLSWTSYVSDNYVEDNNGIHNYLTSSNSYRHQLVYACLQRNRDEDGDGKIDAAEVKWYPASINQYTDIWMGKDALPTEAHLYQNGDVRYRRYCSSTNGKELYSEEGSSIEYFGFWYANSLSGSIAAPTKYDYRCLRNLGMSNDAPTAKTDIPQPYVIHDEANKTFTLTYMASVSIRPEGEFQSGELVNHTELDLLNRPYLKFEYKNAGKTSNADLYSWKAVNKLVDDNKSPCAKFNNGVETGWRLPNQRELSIMAAWCSEDSWGQTYNEDNKQWERSPYHQTRTAASPFMGGKEGSGHCGGYHYMTLPSGGGFPGPVRCVRDVK